MKYVTFGTLTDNDKIYTYIACQDKTIKIILVFTVYKDFF